MGYPTAAVLNLKDMGVQSGEPLFSILSDLQITRGVLDVRAHLSPEEFGETAAHVTR